MSVLPKRQNLKEISQFHDKLTKMPTHQTPRPTLNMLMVEIHRPFLGSQNGSLKDTQDNSLWKDDEESHLQLI